MLPWTLSIDTKSAHRGSRAALTSGDAGRSLDCPVWWWRRCQDSRSVLRLALALARASLVAACSRPKRARALSISIPS